MPTIRRYAQIPIGGARVRYHDDTLKRKQAAMMAQLRQEEVESIATQTETMLNLTEARARVVDHGKDVALFNADLLAYRILGARKQGIQWRIPQAEVDKWITEN